MKDKKPAQEALIKRLNIKAGMIENCERIAFGSDSELMREAASELQSQSDHQRVMEEMKGALEEIKKKGVYSVSSKNRNNKDKFIRENKDNPLCKYTYQNKFGAIAEKALEQYAKIKGELI